MEEAFWKWAARAKVPPDPMIRWYCNHCSKTLRKLIRKEEEYKLSPVSTLAFNTSQSLLVSQKKPFVVQIIKHLQLQRRFVQRRGILFSAGQTYTFYLKTFKHKSIHIPASYDNFTFIENRYLENGDNAKIKQQIKKF